MDQLRIQYVENEDIDRIAHIEQEIFSEPWTRNGFFEAMERKDNVFLVAKLEEQIAGYALLYGSGDEGEIPTIAVAPDYRKNCVGSRLMEALIKEAQARGVEHIFLEVRQSNIAAQRLYEKYNFKVVGKRKQFYRFPTEDALVMAYHSCEEV